MATGESVIVALANLVWSTWLVAVKVICCDAAMALGAL
jgi:hypothetical protein